MNLEACLKTPHEPRRRHLRPLASLRLVRNPSWEGCLLGDASRAVAISAVAAAGSF